nr:hypothetical protein Iba_chr08dCG14780 [Ipomoea batatas]GMD57828.1 hypothetical protein Iba_scaffold1421911CG0010 [Ipomoea batatas]
MVLVCYLGKSHFCKSFTQPYNSFKLPHSNWYCSCLPSFICLPPHILSNFDITLLQH